MVRVQREEYRVAIKHTILIEQVTDVLPLVHSKPTCCAIPLELDTQEFLHGTQVLDAEMYVNASLDPTKEG